MDMFKKYGSDKKQQAGSMFWLLMAIALSSVGIAGVILITGWTIVPNWLREYFFQSFCPHYSAFYCFGGSALFIPNALQIPLSQWIEMIGIPLLLGSLLWYFRSHVRSLGIGGLLYKFLLFVFLILMLYIVQVLLSTFLYA